jgi:ABC-type transport system involved in multi-copper enzyme maturation permease subunit
MPFFTFYSDTSMYKELGLSFAVVFMLLVGLLGAATGIAREVEDKTVQLVLTKRVGRWQFVVGKYVGILGAVAVATGIVAVVFAASVYFRVRFDAGVLERAYARGGIGARVEAFQALQLNQALTILPGMVLVFLQVGVLAAVATALSTRFSPAASVGLSLAVFLVGHLTVFLEGGPTGASAARTAAAGVVTTVLPFLEAFNLNTKLGHAVLDPFGAGGAGVGWGEVWAYVGLAGVYAGLYVIAAIGAGVLLFRRRSLG